MHQKRWNFGFGTFFSLIVIYFIYLYSKDKGWAVLAFISKWYLIIVGGLLALTIGIIILMLLFALFIFLAAAIKLRGLKGKTKNKSKEYFDAEFKVKE